MLCYSNDIDIDDIFFVFTAMKYGDIEALLPITDSNGYRCGIDPGVENKPYLYVFDPVKCFTLSIFSDGCPTTRMCKEQCMTKELHAFDNIDCNARFYRHSFSDYIRNTECFYRIDRNRFRNCNELNQYTELKRCSEYFLGMKPCKCLYIFRRYFWSGLVYHLTDLSHYFMSSFVCAWFKFSSGCVCAWLKFRCWYLCTMGRRKNKYYPWK